VLSNPHSNLEPLPKNPWSALQAEMGQDPSKDVLDHFQGVADGRIVCVPTPWPLLTRHTFCGLPGIVTILCGSPGCGKSWMALEWAAHLLETGYTTALLELENDRKYHVRRRLVQLAKNTNLIDTEWVRNNGDEAIRLALVHEAALDRIGNVIKDSPRDPVTQDACLKWVEEQASSARVVFIDPVTACVQTDKPWIADQKFITELKRIALDGGISIVLVSHPRKGKMQGGPSMDDLAGGAAFQRFVDNVLWLRNDGLEEVNVMSPFGSTEGVEINRRLLMCKTRDGKGAGMDIGMWFDPKSLTFRELGVIVEE
jgi:predicted ATP-dependent serine protease